MTNELNNITFPLAAEIESGKFGLPVLAFLKVILNNIETISFVFDKEGRIIFVNLAADEYLKQLGFSYNIGDFWWKIFWKLDKRPDNVTSVRALTTRTIITEDMSNPHTGNTVTVTAIPLIFNGVSGTICFVRRKE